MQTAFRVRTAGSRLHEITAEVARFVRESGILEGARTTCQRASK